MSDYLPLEIQEEIMKRLPVKSLIQFRSVSKPWMSLINSPDFIKHYSGQQHLLVRYDRDYLYDEPEYVSFVDDDTFPRQKVSPTIPLLVSMLERSSMIGSSHGLLCLSGYYGRDEMAILWNVSIRKAVAIDVPNVAYQKYKTILGLGVCDETCDPKIVKIICINSQRDIESTSDSIPCQVEVFTLSTGVHIAAISHVNQLNFARNMYLLISFFTGVLLIGLL
ncbi:putative F-box domain-containing protein [Helianthus debilis subsp. tardiflorus]